MSSLKGIKDTANALSKIDEINKFNGIATKTSQIDKLSLAVKGLTKEQALLALATGKVNKEDYKTILIKAGVITVEEADKIATDADTASKIANLKVTNMLKVAWAKFTAFAMANPWLVAITATIAGLTALYAVVDHFTLSLEEAKEKLETTESELESVNQQIEELSEQIKELESLETLSITDKEDLEQLKAQNKELEIRQRYLEKQKQNDEKDVSNAAKQEYNRRYDSTSREDIDNRKDALNNPISSGGTASSYLTGGTTTSTTPYAAGQQAQVDTEYDKLADLIAQYELYSEKKKEAIANDDGSKENAELIDKYSKKLGEVETELMNCRTELQCFVDDIGLAGNSEDLENVKGDLALIDETLFSVGERLVDYVNNTLNATDTEKLTKLAQNGELTADILKKNFSEVDEYLKKNGLTLEDLISILDLYQEELENIPDKSGNLKNFEDIFNAESFKDSAKVLKELAISGELSTETFTTTRAYIDLLKEAGLTAEEAIEKIRGISVAETSLSDIMGSLQSNAKLMNEVTSEISNSGQISFDTLQNIASKYPSLERYVTDYLNGVEGAQENLVSALSRLYNNELDNYREYYVLKQQYDNGWYTNYLENTSSWVSNLASKYGIDLKNYANYLETKAALEERINSLNTTNGKIGQATSDGKFHTDDYVANTSQFTNLKQKEDLTKILNDMVKEYENSIPDPTDLLDKFKDDDYTGGLTESTKSSDTYFDHIETRLDRFNDKLDEAKEKANDTFNGWSVRDNSFGEVIDQAKSLVDEYKEARARYEEEANKSGLDPTTIELVQKGAIQIDKLPNDDPLKEQIESYQKWYGKVKECDEAIKELDKDYLKWTNDSRDFRWEAFDYLEDSISRITNEANDLIDLLSNKDLFDDKGNLNEYGNATLALYASNIETYKQQAKDNLEEMKSLQKELANGGGQEVLDKYIFI